MLILLATNSANNTDGTNNTKPRDVGSYPGLNSIIREVTNCLYHQYGVTKAVRSKQRDPTANHPTSIMDFRGLDSSIILISSGGILMSIGNFPESLSQAMLVGVMLVGGLGVTLRTTP